ncbi:MAG: DedA family protein [Terriglobales bacterium]
MQIAFAHFQAFFQHYGLASVFVLLLLENLGVPLPGELSLLYAGFHMRLYGGFTMLELILVGVAGSSTGQLLGFALGRYACGWVRGAFRLTPTRYSHYETYFRHHGAVTILLARFVTGLRIFAGLMAGLGKMRWRTFILYDIGGAFLWVTVIAMVGALLGRHWRHLLRVLGRVDLLILLAAIVLITIAWRRLRGGDHA